MIGVGFSTVLAAALGGYLLGSIPFGLLLTRAFGAGDIRRIGSGNIGATNVLRTGRKGLALATLLLDGGKGAVAALIAAAWGGADLGLLAAGCAVLGHLFPVWLGFRGGKGVATTLGVLLAAAFPVGAIACLVWLGVALAFRYSSLAALVAIAISPLVAAGFDRAGPAWLALGLAVLVVARHGENIRRLAAGTESRIRLGRGGG